jgi:hypothetical protein
MKTVKYCVLLLLTGFYIRSSAQERQFRFTINYTAGIPTGNFKNITDKASGRGLEAALMYGINSELSLGLQAGFQDFYKKFPRQLFHDNGSDLSAVVTNSVMVLPVMIKGKYRFSQGTVQPFAALAAGGNLISYRKFYGEFSGEKNAFRFAAQPEAGIQIPAGINKHAEFHLAAAYNIMPFKYSDASGLNHAVIKAGFSFMLR